MKHHTERIAHLERAYLKIPREMENYDVVNFLIYGKLDQVVIDWKSLLSAQERLTASKILVSHVQHNFILRRTLLKELLGRIMLIPAAEVPLKMRTSFKPSVFHGPFFSHANKLNCLLYSFSFFSDHGVDIEYLEDNVDIEGIASLLFSQKEKEKMLTLSGREKFNTFLEIWTQKEAILKCFGKGWKCSIAFEKANRYSWKIASFLLSIASRNRLSRMKTFIYRI